MLEEELDDGVDDVVDGAEDDEVDVASDFAGVVSFESPVFFDPESRESVR